MKGVPQAPVHQSAAKYVSEFLGVYFLVLTIGCNVQTTSIGAPLSIGMMLAVMVFSLGSVSGAHLNPAVSFAICLRGHMVVYEALVYMCVQTLGGLFGALTYSGVTGGAFVLTPAFNYTAGAALSVELMYSFALCYVVLNVATTAKDKGNQYFGLAIGLTVTAAAVAIGGVSGCSLNPAVSFGSLMAAAMRYGFSSVHFWGLYVLTPFLGAFLAAFAFMLVRPQEAGYRFLGFEPIDGKPRRRVPEEPPVYTPPPVPVAPPREAAPPPPPPRPTGPQQLASGETFKIPPALEASDVAVGLSYELHDPSLRGMLEIDGSCVKFDRDGRCLGAVYFADKEDTESGITHYGLHTGELGSFAHGDDDQIRFRLQKVKKNVQFMFFVVTLFSDGQHSLQDVKKCHARLVNMSNPGASEVAKFTRSFEASESGNAYVAIFLYRGQDGHWSWEAVDKAYTLVEAGTYRMLEPQLKRLCLQRREMGM